MFYINGTSTFHVIRHQWTQLISSCTYNAVISGPTLFVLRFVLSDQDSKSVDPDQTSRVSQTAEKKRLN